MIAVIFEVEPVAGGAERYFELAEKLRAAIESHDGFVSIERFQSLVNPEKYLSLSIWRDEAAVEAWFADAGHKRVQKEGRENIFRDYRIRVARIFRDYDMKAGRP